MSDYPAMHSLYGRMLGASYDGYISGEKGVKANVVALTSASTATNITAHGITTMSVTTGSSSAGASFVLDAPVKGVTKVIVNATTASTQAITITTTAAFMTGAFAPANVTAGSSWNTLTFNTKGEMVELIGLSTVYYLVTNLNGFTTGDTPFSVT